MGFFIEHSMWGETVDAVVVDSRATGLLPRALGRVQNVLSRILGGVSHILSKVFAPLRKSCGKTAANFILWLKYIKASSPFEGTKPVQAKYRMFVAVPAWHGGNNNEGYFLRQCYMNAVQAAMQKNFQSVAFPVLGLGESGYPADLALNTALDALGICSREYDIDLYLVLSNEDDYLQSLLQSSLEKKKRQMTELLEYVSERYEKPSVCYEAPIKYSIRLPHDDAISDEAKQIAKEVAPILPEKDRGVLFWEYFQSLIKRTGKSKVEIYKRANLDRRIFSKIQNTKGSAPSKRTILALAIALQLSLDDTQALLEQAGFALSPAVRSDVIVEYFITHKKFDIQLINEALYYYHESLLGSMSWDERKF